MRRLIFLVVAVAALCCATSPVTADICFNFTNITNNNSIEYDVAGQLRVFVSQENSQVAFTFYNDVGVQSSIADIYFADGSLFNLDEPVGIVNSATGVAFNRDANPAELPGGGDFNTTASFFSADSEPPVQPNGVNASSEWVKILFDLKTDEQGRLLTLADVVADLNSGELRIGLHIQGLSNGGSDSYVNSTTPIPTPAAFVLAALGLGLVSQVRRRT